MALCGDLTVRGVQRGGPLCRSQAVILGVERPTVDLQAEVGAVTPIGAQRPGGRVEATHKDDDARAALDGIRALC